jgi:hypothetical protein
MANITAQKSTEPKGGVHSNADTTAIESNITEIKGQAY